LDVDGSVNATTYYGDGSNLTGISGTADADWIIEGDTIYHAVGPVGIGTASPAYELDVLGSVNASTYYGDGSNLTGISGTADADWTISGSDMYSAVSGDVGIGTSSPIGKLHVVGSNGNYAQFGRTSYAVYGVNPNNNNYGYFGGDYGAFGSDTGSGNYGYMGSSSYGLYARHNSSGNNGYVGGGPYAARFTHSSSGNLGRIGTSGEGVYGKYGDNNNYGTLGSYSWGVYGNHADSSNYGGLGGAAWGAHGHNHTGNYGVLGTKDYGVYYSGGISGTGKGGLIVRTEDGPKEMCLHQSTENWCEDFGSGQILGGRAEIRLADDFRQTVTVSMVHPLKVFITPNERIGEWWVEKDTDGFTLVAPDAPQGALFDFRVVAKRQGYEEKRLVDAPAGYGDHHLYPDIADVPLEYRERWHQSAPVQRTQQ
jgi:hypothetical protein